MTLEKKITCEVKGCQNSTLNMNMQKNTLTPSTCNIVCLIGSKCCAGIAASTSSKILIIDKKKLKKAN
jgi:hypothetical protein